jgi:anaerobic carbon-monoxide dehydrogenase iron sulfur subunit
MKQLIITPKLCIDCHVCELACSFSHSQEFSMSNSRVKTIKYPREEVTVPEICLQCVDAACVQSCPATAIYVDESIGAVLIDYERCVGCMSCVGGCPFGNMLTDPEAIGYVFKCDLCFGDPVCAKFCPTGALVYTERGPMAGRQIMVLEEEVPEPVA